MSKSKESRAARGKTGEDLACHYLQTQGLILIERNFRCRTGELDLIMRDQDHLVFIEVRSRASERYGSPAETVTKAKQQRLIRAAAFYLQRKRSDIACRFDIVAITYTPEKPKLDWIKNAFQAF